MRAMEPGRLVPPEQDVQKLVVADEVVGFVVARSRSQKISEIYIAFRVFGEGVD